MMDDLSSSSSDQEQKRPLVVASALTRGEEESRTSSSTDDGDDDDVPRKQKATREARTQVTARTRPSSKQRKAKEEAILALSTAADDSWNADEEDIVVFGAKKRRRRKQTWKDETYGDYVLRFQNAHTGRKQIHPSAMQCALKVMEDEARRTADSVSSSLLKDGEVKESLNVQVQSSSHTKTIISRVRRRLTEATIPERYVKIEDLITADLGQRNAKRQEEIEEHGVLAKQLEQQRKRLQKEYDTAKARRDRLQGELSALTATEQPENESETLSIHPLLVKPPSTSVNNTRTERSSKRALRKTNGMSASAPRDTLLRYLQQVPSPYD